MAPEKENERRRATLRAILQKQREAIAAQREQPKPKMPADAPTISEVIGVFNAFLEELGDVPVYLSNGFRERWEVPMFEILRDRSGVYIE